MDAKRAKAIIKAIIESLSQSTDEHNVIMYLLYVGMTGKELIDDFGFKPEAVMSAEQGMTDYQCEISLTD